MSKPRAFTELGEGGGEHGLGAGNKCLDTTSLVCNSGLGKAFPGLGLSYPGD